MTFNFTDHRDDDFSATYTPTDDKIRLYTGRVDRELYDALREAGFSVTSKQDCDFSAVWTPRREDIALALIPEDETIGDEDYTHTERAHDRAERFSEYREKRRAEAHGHANAYESGPDAYGNQNARRAERLAARRDRTRDRALVQWGKAEYWQSRTQGVIDHALHKESPEVRRRRIKKLKSEQRKAMANHQAAVTWYESWAKIGEMDGAEMPCNARTISVQQSRPNGAHIHYGMNKDANEASKAAYQLAGNSGGSWDHQHPRDESKRDSLWGLLTDEENPISPAEAAELAIGKRQHPDITGSYSRRWAEHIENRLTYENAMLENEGGAASRVEMVPGGFIGRHQLLKVHKSSATGEVVSVTIWGKDWHGNPANQKVNIESLAADVYRAPTPEELEAFKAKQKAKPKAPSLINPTPETAQRLAELIGGDVREMTQKQYSYHSKGNDWYGAASVTNDGCVLFYRGDVNKRTADLVCKVRSEGHISRARSIIVLTDKPQKPIPIDFDAIETAQTEAAATA